MELLLIRHSITEGNLARRYVGRTDEGLCGEGVILARDRALTLPEPDLVFISPMRRCLETAVILFPGKEPQVVPGLRETDFGAFEYLTYEDLKDDPAYRAWLDTGGAGAIPGGESQDEVRRRVLAALDGLLAGALAAPAVKRAALVIHGGTIMTILSERGEPPRPYYDWQVKNCEGYLTVPEGGRLRVVQRI